MIIFWIILFLLFLIIYSNNAEGFVNSNVYKNIYPYEISNINNKFINLTPNIHNIWIKSARDSQELYNKTYAYGLYNNIIYDNFKYQPTYPETMSMTGLFESNSPIAFNTYN